MYLVEPVVLQAGLGDVLAGDDAGHSVVAVQHHQVPQTHRAEKSVQQLDCQNRVCMLFNGSTIDDNDGKGTYSSAARRSWR